MGKRRSSGIIPKDLKISLALAALILALVGNHAVFAGADLAFRDKTVPAFIGVELGAVLIALHQYGKWIIDFVRAQDPVGGRLLRRDARDLLAIGAAALGSIVLHVAIAGTELARSNHTVPAFFGSTITVCLGSLTEFGLWVLEYARPAKKTKAPPVSP